MSDETHVAAGREARRCSSPQPGGGILGTLFADPLPAVEDGPAESLTAWLDGGCAILDSAGRITTANEPLVAWLDRTAAELSGQVFWDLLAQRCAAWAEPLARLRAEPDAFCAIRLRLAMGPSAGSGQSPGPQAVWFRLESARHETASFVRFQSILPPLSDLEESSWDDYLRTESARREMFVRLLRAEAQLKNLTDRWPGVIFSQRADFSFRFVSAQIERLTGAGLRDWQAKPQLFWQLVHEGDAEELRAKIRAAKETRQPLTATYRVRHLETGRVSYVLEHRQTHVSGAGLLLGYEGVWLDVTRQTIAEKSLAAASSKDTLSVLTMGLAHDFGNVMAGIHALSESFLEQDGAAHEFTEGLTLIKRNAQQASQLVHRIIDLHQGRTGESNYHNLNELAADIADLVRKIVPRRMQFALELCPEALPVYVDAVELRQVVMHLVLNAREAMPENGRLVLRTSAWATMPSLSGLQGARPRTPAACLSLQDSGCGIKAAHLPNIFDPFFTTKPANKGTGLGLHNARLFVERHQGGISVDTQESAGTTFSLWLPQADFTETAPGANGASARKPPRDI